MAKRITLILQIVLVLAGVAGGVYVSLTPANSLMRWYNVDDAFYYYKVAQNVLTGHGFTFDQINLTNGFHPLWMVICLGVFAFSSVNLLFPLRLLVLVSALFNAASGLLLFNWTKKYLHIGAAFVISIVWMLLPSIYSITTVHGMEASISAFFIILFLSLSTKFLVTQNEVQRNRKSLLLIGLVGAAVILSRLDNIFLVAIVGLFLILRVKKIFPLVLVDLLAISFSVFAAWILRLGSTAFESNAFSIYPMLAVAILIKPAAYYFSGLYLHKKPRNWFITIIFLGIATAAAFLLEYLTLTLLFKFGAINMLSKSVIALDAILCFLLVAIVRILSRHTIQYSADNPFNLFGSWFRLSLRRVLLDGVFFAIPIAVLLGIYTTFNKIVFGSFMPVSGQIKQWWSTMPNTIYAHKSNLISVLGLSPDGNNGPWSLLTSWLSNTSARIGRILLLRGEENVTIIFACLLGIGIFLFIMVMRAQKGKLARVAFGMLLPALLVGCLVQIAYYTSSGYQHTRSWYWVAEMLTLVIFGGVLLSGFFDWLDSPQRKIKISILITLVILIWVINQHVSYVKALAPTRVPKDQQAEYLIETHEIEKLTPEGSLIGMTGGGSVAYFIQNRTVVNLDGLINSVEYFHAMKEGTARAFLDKMGLDYVYGKPYTFMETDPYRTILEARLVEIGFIRGPENFTLFKYSIDQ